MTGLPRSILPPACSHPGRRPTCFFRHSMDFPGTGAIKNPASLWKAGREKRMFQGRSFAGRPSKIPRWGTKMRSLGVPLMFTNILQVLFNMSDVAVVGKFAGAIALGAVGSTSILVTLFTGILLGLASGVNALTALHIGSKDDEGSSAARPKGQWRRLAYSTVVSFGKSKTSCDW